jgi:pilus assembly protein CpaB
MRGQVSRRIAGFVAAIVLALVGTVALVAYVNTAEQRALAGEELVDVYVVGTAIPSGTAAQDIVDHVTVEQVPVKVRASGAVGSLHALSGQVAAIDLVPGEQLVAERFVERSELAHREVGIEVPEEMVEVSIELDGQRAVGGLLEAGQTVAVFASFDPFEHSRTVVDVDGEAVPLPSSVAGDLEGSTSRSTDLLLHKVLITAVQAPSGSRPDDEEQRLTTAPDAPVLVTLAVHPFDAERLVFTAEFGTIWLAMERATVPDTSVPGQTRGSVLLDRAEAR